MRVALDEPGQDDLTAEVDDLGGRLRGERLPGPDGHHLGALDKQRGVAQDVGLPFHRDELADVLEASHRWVLLRVSSIMWPISRS